jgi:hypothetical protein
MIDINVKSSVSLPEEVLPLPLKMFDKRFSSALTGKIWTFLITNTRFMSDLKSSLLEVGKKNKVTGKKLKSVDVEVSVALDMNKVEAITLYFNNEDCREMHRYVYPIPFCGTDVVPFMVEAGKSIKKQIHKEFLNWVDVSWLLFVLGIYPCFKYAENPLHCAINLLFLIFLFLLIYAAGSYIRNKKCVFYSSMKLCSDLQMKDI